MRQAGRSTSKLKSSRTDKLIALLLFILSLLIIVPLLIMIFGSFKSAQEAAQFNLKPPTSWEISNYSYVITTGKIGRAFLNSVIVTAGTVLIAISTATMAGFVIARRSDRTAKLYQSYFMMGLVAPMQMITTFALLKATGILGSYFAVIMVMAAGQIPWALFMTVNFVKGVPRDLDHAALIDGAGPFRMFFAVIMPVLKPILATTIVLVAMHAWNEFMIPLYFFNNAERWTMPLTVYNFFGQYFSNWNYVFADLVLTALPITLLYLYSQKYVISGLTAGAVKG